MTLSYSHFDIMMTRPGEKKKSGCNRGESGRGRKCGCRKKRGETLGQIRVKARELEKVKDEFVNNTST